MRDTTLALGALALLCAACAEPAETGAEAVSPDQREGALASPVPVGPGDGAAPPAAVPVGMIPANFRGVWDLASGNCMPSSDLRMEIRSDEIEFYESLGEVEAVAIESPTAIRVALAMSGEGETWAVTNRLVLSEDGTILTPHQTDADPQYQPIPRKRCP